MSQTHDSASPSPKRSRLSDVDIKGENPDCQNLTYTVVNNNRRSIEKSKSLLLNEFHQLTNASSSKHSVISPELADTKIQNANKIFEPIGYSNLKNSIKSQSTSHYQRFVHIPPPKIVVEDKNFGSVSNNVDVSSNHTHQNKEIAERAKQEANVLQRISQLRKQGLWSATRLPIIMEPKRRKSHWDYLLDEMEWMAVDFIEEQKWKKAAAKKLADAAQKHFLAKEERLKQEEEEIQRYRQIAASSTSNIVKDWFETIKERQESLFCEGESHFIDLLSSKANRVVDHLTDSCPQWFEDAADSECMLSGQDEDFVLPANDMADSESSFSESWEEKSLSCDDDQWWLGENADSEETALKMEIRTLKEEGDLPLADLLQNIPAEVLSKPSKFQESVESSSTSSTLDYEKEVEELLADSNLPLEEVLERHYGLSCDDLSEPPFDYLLSDAEDDEASQSSDSSVSSEKESFVSAESSSIAFHIESSKYSSANDMQVMADKLRHSINSNNIKPISCPSSLCTKSSIELPSDHISALQIMISFYEENLPLLLMNCLDSGEADPLLVFYLAHLATSKEAWGPSLVVLPSNNLLDWRVRCMKIAPGLKVAVYSNNDGGFCHPWRMKDANICLASYSDLRENCDYFTNQKWMVVICDQIHLLINEPSTDSDCTKNKQTVELSSNEETVIGRISLINKITCCSQRIFVASWSDLSDLTVSESVNLLNLLVLHDACPDNQSWLPPDDPVSKLIKKSLDTNQDEDEILDQLQKFLDPFVCRLDDEFENQVDEHVVLCGLSTRQSSLFQRLSDSAKSHCTQKSGHLLDLLDVVRSARQIACHPYLLECSTEVVPVTSPLVFPLDRQEPLVFSLPGQVVKAVIEWRTQRDQVLLPRLLSPMSKDLGKFVRDRVFQLRPNPGMIEELANIDPSGSVTFPKSNSIERPFLTEDDHRQLRVERSRSLHNCSSDRDNQSQIPESIVEIRLDNNGLSRHHVMGTRVSVNNGSNVDIGQYNGNTSPNKQTVPGTTRPTFSNTTLAARRTRTLLKSRLTSLNRENERRCCLLQNSTQWFNSDLVQMLTISSSKNIFLDKFSSQRHDAMLTHQFMDSVAPRFIFPVRKVISFSPTLISPCKSCCKESFLNGEDSLVIRSHLKDLTQISSVIPDSLLSFPSFDSVREKSGKLWILDQLLVHILVEQRQKLVLLSHMEDFLDLIEYWIDRSSVLRCIPRSRIDCQSEPAAKYAAVERHNAVPDNQPFLFLLAGRSGEVALNLLMPRNVIIVDVDWRPGVEDLLKTRLYRWALNSRCFSRQNFSGPPLKVFRLVSERTVEDYLFNQQGSRLLMQTVFTEKSAPQPLVQARVQPNIIHGFLRGFGRVWEHSGPGSTIADDAEVESCADSEQSNRVSTRLESAIMSQAGAYFQRRVNLGESAVERAVELFESPRDVASWCRLEGEFKSCEAEIKGLFIPDYSPIEKCDLQIFNSGFPSVSSDETNEDNKVHDYWSAIERWEVQQYARNLKIEAKRALLEEDDTILTYRHDILKDYTMKSNQDDTEMPTYCLSFDVSDEDHYIDPSHILCYQLSAMQDNELPPISLIPSPTYVSAPTRTAPNVRVSNALARKRELSWARRRNQLAGREAAGEVLDDIPGGHDSSFDGDQTFHPGTPKRRKLNHADKRGINDGIHPAVPGTSDNPACYGGMKGAPMKGKFDKNAPGYSQSHSSNVGGGGVENRLVTVTLVGSSNQGGGGGQMRVQVTKPFYLRDVGNKSKLRRHCLQPGFPMSLQHQRFQSFRLSGGLGPGMESSSSYLMSKRLEFQAHEEAALYHSISQLQGLPFDTAAAERSPTAQTFLPNFQLAELYLNDYVGTQCHRGTLQLAFYYDKMQNTQNSSFHPSGMMAMSNQGQSSMSASNFGPGDSVSVDAEPGTPGRKMKNKHKSPSINRFQAANYGSNLQGLAANSLSGGSYRGDACSGEQLLSTMIKSTLQKLVKRRMTAAAVTTVSAIKSQATASGAAGTNTALSNTASMTTSAMIQKNPTHIQTLQDLNINPEQLITPAIVLRNKEEKEEKDRLNKQANNASDAQQAAGHSNQQLTQTQQFAVQTNSNPVAVLQSAAQQGTGSNIQGGNLVGSRLVASNTIPSVIGGQQATMAVQTKIAAVGASLPTVAVGQVASVPQRFMSTRPGASILVSSATSVAGSNISVGQGLTQIPQQTYKRSVAGTASNVIATTSRVGPAVQHATSRHLIATGSTVSGTHRIQLPPGSAATGQQVVNPSGANVRQGIITQAAPGHIYAQMSRQNPGGSMIKRGGSAAVNRMPGANQVAASFSAAAAVRGNTPQGTRLQRPNVPASINTTILRQRGQMGNSHVLKKTPSSGGAGVVYNNLQIISSGSGVSTVVTPGSSGNVSITGQAGAGLSARGNISTTTVTAQQIQQLILSGQGVVMANTSSSGQPVSGSLASLTAQQSQAQQQRGAAPEIIISRVPTVVHRHNQPHQFYQQKNQEQ